VTADLLVVDNVCKTYARAGTPVRVLAGASATIRRGDVVAVVGASGAGKSTLLHVMGTLDAPDTGCVRYGGENLSAMDEAALAHFRARELGFVFQFHHLLGDFDALENVMMPAWIQRLPTPVARRRAAAVLEEVGLSHRLHHRPSELSGGEQQRVALARALVMDPALILADEVTGNLDAKTAAGIHALLFSLNARRQVTLVVVTHNSAFAASMPRQLTLQGGQLIEGPLQKDPPCAP
jgi:lipoprotein-releasing system ATP-binding protein